MAMCEQKTWARPGAHLVPQCKALTSTWANRIGSLKSDVFERRTSTGSGIFAHLSRDFEQILD